MSKTAQTRELSDTLLEIGSKLCPRRYRRFKDLRTFEDAQEWARTLDWQDNPYDRFLLRREILRQLESIVVHEPGFRNVYTYASREEIAAKVDELLNHFPARFERMGALIYVLTALPWHLAFKHGLIRHSRLAQALSSTKAKK